MAKLQCFMLVILGIGIGSLPWTYSTVVVPGVRQGMPQLPAVLPHWGTGLALAIAVGLIWQGIQGFGRSFKRGAKPAGQESREITLAVLNPLVRQGWRIQENVVLEKPESEPLDLLLISPQKKYFCIKIQPHRGKVQGNQSQIFRVYDQSQRPFERDLLAQVRQQAAILRTRYRTDMVPVLVFPEAIVEGFQDPIAGVYVTGRLNLRACVLQCNQKLGRSPATPQIDKNSGSKATLQDIPSDSQGHPPGR